jgi:hypothetical protein
MGWDTGGIVTVYRLITWMGERRDGERKDGDSIK